MAPFVIFRQIVWHLRFLVKFVAIFITLQESFLSINFLKKVVEFFTLVPVCIIVRKTLAIRDLLTQHS